VDSPGNKRTPSKQRPDRRAHIAEQEGENVDDSEGSDTVNLSRKGKRKSENRRDEVDFQPAPGGN
jgi:hypothetical protein